MYRAIKSLRLTKIWLISRQNRALRGVKKRKNVIAEIIGTQMFPRYNHITTMTMATITSKLKHLTHWKFKIS